MELKEFVTAVLTEIVQGVEAAKHGERGSHINPKPRKDTSITKLHEAGFFRFDGASSTS